MIYFLYSCLSSFWSFSLGISCFLLFSLFFRFKGGLIPYTLILSSYYLFLITTVGSINSIGFFSIYSATFRQQLQARLTPGSRPIGDNLLTSSFFPLV